MSIYHTRYSIENIVTTGWCLHYILSSVLLYISRISVALVFCWGLSTGYSPFPFILSVWMTYFYSCLLRSECGGTQWRMGGEVKGKLANGVGSQYSHTTLGHSVSSITNADAHTSAASSRLNWRPRRFKWTRPFRRKKKTGFCACAITFRTSSTILMFILLLKCCMDVDCMFRRPCLLVFKQIYCVTNPNLI